MAFITEHGTGIPLQADGALRNAQLLIGRARDFACLCQAGRLILLNDAALRLLGDSSATGSHFTSLVHKDDVWALNSWWENGEDCHSFNMGARRHCRIGNETHGWQHFELTRACHRAGKEQFEIILGRRIENQRDAPAARNVSQQVQISSASAAAIRRERVKRKWAERNVRRLAYQDHLTGLINRVYFQMRLKNALRTAGNSGKCLVLMFIDIDRFKDINDLLGQSIGDALLKLIAARLKSCIRVTDTVARTGGDEFAILVNDLRDSINAEALAQKLMHALAEPFQVEEHILHISSSAGVTIYPDDGTDAERLQKNASLALHHAKQTGAGRIQIFNPEMDANIRSRKHLEDELRYAIGNDQLVVHYQPKVEICTGHVLGIEALVRWRHPDRGLIPPVLFVPLAEASGLIQPMTEFVMRAACEDLRRCHEMGIDLGHVSVNLSANLVQTEDLAGMVKRILAQTRLPAKHLELEITESILMEDLDKARAALNSIYLIGVALSLDDFGTGYSSLTYLRQFPFRTLKIDRSFVTDMSESSEDIAIVRAVIALAHSLKLRVVAEGVENEAQLQILKDEGCDEVQGYYYSRPQPMPELIKWLIARREAAEIEFSAGQGGMRSG